eukprot:9977977-Alexandrium_andersonii.AAC.1
MSAMSEPKRRWIRPSMLSGAHISARRAHDNCHLPARTEQQSMIDASKCELSRESSVREHQSCIS